MKNTKGLAVEHLARTIIMISLVIVVLFIIKDPAEAALKSLFSSNLESSLKEFVGEIDNLQVRSKQIFLPLDKNTAIIGFSSKTKEFRCFGCGLDTKDVTSYINKPDSEQCKDRACICLCYSLKLPDTRGKYSYEMKCERMSCEVLKKDLFDVIEHKNYLEKLEKQGQTDYSKLKNARWEGGFLFEKHSRGDFVSNGLPQKQEPKFTVVVIQENTVDDVYVAVCPGEECTYSFKFQSTQIQLPSNICQIMYDCYNKENNNYLQDVRRVTYISGPENFCRYNRPATRQYTKEDCEKIQACTNSKLQTSIPSKCTDKGDFYELTFLP